MRFVTNFRAPLVTATFVTDCHELVARLFVLIRSVYPGEFVVQLSTTLVLTLAIRRIGPPGWLVTVTTAVEELFPDMLSNVAAPTLAVFDFGPSSNDAAVMVTVAVALLAMVPRLHVTVPPD